MLSRDPGKRVAVTGILLSIALLVSAPIYSQAISPVNPAPFPGSDLMVTPPPVRIFAYPTETRAEMRSNYVQLGATFGAAYIDNLYAGITSEPLHETTYSIMPTFAVDRTTTRGHTTMIFSPGFTLYQPTSLLNEMDQSGTLMYEFRLTPHSDVSISDRFVNSSTSLSPATLEAGGTVIGTAQIVTPGIIAPFAQRLTNAANGEFTLQTGKNSMIGASGATSLLNYGEVSETGGLYNSNSRSGLAFYSKRFVGTRYLGAMYEFAQIVANPSAGESVTRLETTSLFLTVYPTPNLSLSIAGGPQLYRLTQAQSPRARDWEPTGAASMGWQGRRTSFAASYSHSITAGGGLLGAFRSDSANGALHWQVARTWTAGASASYAINKPVASWMVGASSGGHTVAGVATVEHALGRQTAIGVDYTRLHQSYVGIAAIASNPDSNRESVYISWHFMRPWGR
jgi:hypothetical protein